MQLIIMLFIYIYILYWYLCIHYLNCLCSGTYNTTFIHNTNCVLFLMSTWGGDDTFSFILDTVYNTLLKVSNY